MLLNQYCTVLFKDKNWVGFDALKNWTEMAESLRIDTTFVFA